MLWPAEWEAFRGAPLCSRFGRVSLTLSLGLSFGISMGSRIRLLTPCGRTHALPHPPWLPCWQEPSFPKRPLVVDERTSAIPTTPATWSVMRCQGLWMSARFCKPQLITLNPETGNRYQQQGFATRQLSSFASESIRPHSADAASPAVAVKLYLRLSGCASRLRAHTSPRLRALSTSSSLCMETVLRFAAMRACEVPWAIPTYEGVKIHGLRRT